MNVLYWFLFYMRTFVIPPRDGPKPILAVSAATETGTKVRFKFRPKPKLWQKPSSRFERNQNRTRNEVKT